MKRILALFTLFGCLLAFQANAADVPTSDPGTTVVNAAEAKKLIDAGTPVFDVRVASEFAESHIKGARNIPYKEKSAKAVDFDSKDDAFEVAKLPSDKAAAIVIYCNGPECWKSYKASKAAVAAGYKKVYWFRGGYPEWHAAGYPVE